MPPADLNGLVRFAERRKLFSARASSHFNWSLTVVTHGWQHWAPADSNKEEKGWSDNEVNISVLAEATWRRNGKAAQFK